MIVLLMGVSGVGKTTVGKGLASHLSWPFHDADDLHSPGNVERMRSGRPLDDEARMPWLRAVRDLIRALAQRGENAVVACSALKASYRAMLLDGAPDVRIVHLTAPVEVLRKRVGDRAGHFMPAALIESQVSVLEPPADALTIDATQPVADVVQQIVDGLNLRP